MHLWKWVETPAAAEVLKDRRRFPLAWRLQWFSCAAEMLLPSVAVAPQRIFSLPRIFAAYHSSAARSSPIVRVASVGSLASSKKGMSPRSGRTRVAAVGICSFCGAQKAALDASNRVLNPDGEYKSHAHIGEPCGMVGKRRIYNKVKVCRILLLTFGALWPGYGLKILCGSLQQAPAESADCNANEETKPSEESEVAADAEKGAERLTAVSQAWISNEKPAPVDKAKAAASTVGKKEEPRTSSTPQAGGNGKQGRSQTGEDTKEGTPGQSTGGEIPQERRSAPKNSTGEEEPAASGRPGTKGTRSEEAIHKTPEQSSDKHVNGQGTEDKNKKQKGITDRQGKESRKKQQKKTTAPPLDPEAPIEELLDPANIHKETLTSKPFGQLKLKWLPTDPPPLRKYKKKADSKVYEEAHELYVQVSAVPGYYDKNTDIAEAKASPPRKLDWSTRFLEAADRFFARWGPR